MYWVYSEGITLTSIPTERDQAVIIKLPDFSRWQEIHTVNSLLMFALLLSTEIVLISRLINKQLKQKTITGSMHFNLLVKVIRFSQSLSSYLFV